MSTQPSGCTSFKTDILPKFTTEDIDHMNRFGIDLGDYATVRDNADLILERLLDTDNPMPPEPRGPWSAEWIECFRDWISNGRQP